MVDGHHVVIHDDREMPAGGLTVDESPRLQGGFLRVALASQNNAVVFGPFGRLLYFVIPTYVGEPAVY